jgi:predicted homoserine dehydrogenase-like protein
MLDRLRRLDRPIRFTIVGAGAMGKGLLYQSLITPGLTCVGIADVDVDRAVAAAHALGCNSRVVTHLTDLHRAIQDGVLAVCDDGELLARCELSEAFVEASNSIIPAARMSIAALECRKHLILMNSEIDLAFGPYFLALARAQGVAYTSCDGDQHGVIKRLIDDLRLWGFDLVMAGNIKGYLDRYSDPVKIVPEADKRNLGYKMATAYTDGTKLSIEMALIANACGLSTLVPGMCGPRATSVHQVFDLFDFQSIRAGRQPVVDYILGAQPDGGVFAIGHCDNPYQRTMLAYYKMGKGPFYLFYRPYHLCHVEAMEGIAAACLDGRSILQPNHGLRTNVIAYAKKPLRQGERLDGVGGFTCYGMIENIDPAAHDPGLPIGLAEDVLLLRDIETDSRLCMNDVQVDHDRLDFVLHSKSVATSRADG